MEFYSGATGQPGRFSEAFSLRRSHQGERHTVTVVSDGYVWRDITYASLSTIARAITGTGWSGPRFFGIRTVGKRVEDLIGARAKSPDDDRTT
jgi:Protein of unknown function (DUF2924)